jgi:hypothetical protein
MRTISLQRNPHDYIPLICGNTAMFSLFSDRNIYSLGATEPVEPMKQAGKVMEQFRVA